MNWVYSVVMRRYVFDDSIVDCCYGSAAAVGTFETPPSRLTVDLVVFNEPVTTEFHHGMPSLRYSEYNVCKYTYILQRFTHIPTF